MEFIKYLQHIRGTGAIGAELTDGIFWELTMQLHNGEPGLYGDILKMYSDIGGSKADFDTKYSDFLIKHQEVLNSADAAAISEAAAKVSEDNARLSAASITDLTVNSVEYTEDASWDNVTSTLSIPDGIPGTNGLDGASPNIAFSYNEATGNLESEVVSWDYHPTTNIEEIA